MELDPGRYEVEVTARGYDKDVRWVELAAGEDKYVTVRLNRRGGSGRVTGVTGWGSSTVEDELTNALGMDVREDPSRSFMMGSPESEPGRYEDEKQHRVTITRPFWLQTTEVTQGQWEAVMGGNPSIFKSCGRDCPVEQVSWLDAVKYCNAVSKQEGLQPAYRISGESVTWDRNANGYRLPTEAEWEYAARGGTTTAFAFGRCLSTSDGNYDGNCPQEGCSKGTDREKPVAVGSLGKMRGACMTCTEMCGNGAGTGTGIIRAVQCRTLWVRHRARAGSGVAAAGTSAPVPAGPRFALGARRASGATSSGSASPGAGPEGKSLTLEPCTLGQRGGREAWELLAFLGGKAAGQRSGEAKPPRRGPARVGRAK